MVQTRQNKTAKVLLAALLSVVMTLALVFAVKPFKVTAYAVTTAWDTDQTISATDTIDGGITIGSDITLTIDSDVTLTVNGGINAGSNTLTVAGAGTLVVTGANESAGITGNLVVNGGSVTVTGGNGGNGYTEQDDGTPGGNGGAGVNGAVTVQSGSITATGGNGGKGGFAYMGIAGSGGNGGAGITGNLVVNGGSVTATGGNGGNGGDIDGGADPADGGKGGAGVQGNVTSLGSVTAAGGNGGSGSKGEKADNGKAITGTIDGSAEESDDNSTWNEVSGTTSTKQYVEIITPVTVDLSTLTGDYTAQKGNVLTGTLGGNYKISVADGAKITLDGVTIEGENGNAYKWAGINCPGDATIVLKGENIVKGFHEDYPAIIIASGKTLTIKGDGSLDASSNDDNYAPAIGSDFRGNCGNIVIESGNITATSANSVAIGGRHACGDITIKGGTVIANGDSVGIGSDYDSCGKITISGGTVTANGRSVGIGTDTDDDSCGDITISGGTVTANGGSVGIGNEAGTCGKITISGGTVSATGGFTGPGIGTNRGTCGDITISGGTVTATGGNFGPGIGFGPNDNAGTGEIKITDKVKKVKAIKGSYADASICAGKEGELKEIDVAGTKYTTKITDDAFVYTNVNNTAVIALINEIPATVTYDEVCQAKIAAARTEYDLLEDYQKAEDDIKQAYAVLAAAEEQYANLEAAAAVDKLIEAIGTVAYDADSKGKIDAARKAYNALDAQTQQSLVENYTKLTDAEAEYTILENNAKAAAVDDLIEAIGEVAYDADSKDKIDAARTAYDALDAQTQQPLVENHETLTKAEADYAKLKADHEAAEAVNAKISAIGAVTYDADSKDKIDAARTAYDALTSEQKQLVTNADVLTAADYDADSKGKIDAARTAYDALTSEQKQLVTNADVLTAAEADYAKLEADHEAAEQEAAAKAPKGLSGGVIALIVILCVLVLGCGGFAIFWFVIKKKTFADFIAIFKKN